MIIEDKFIPPWYMKNGVLQTILSNSGIRKIWESHLDTMSEEMIINAGEGVMLQGFLTQADESSKGMVVLLHGWEGSAHSGNILYTARHLHKEGYDVFRLNLKDHGKSHHLNEDIFMGSDTDEVYEAVKNIAALSVDKPLFIIGFSIGANYTIRIAKKSRTSGIPNLQKIIAINPPLDPERATGNIDRLKIIKYFFIQKWKNSLEQKEKLFPHLYDFKEIMVKKSCMGMIDMFVKNLSSFKDASDHFKSYNLTRGFLDSLEVPALVIAAEDDPIVPADDFYRVRTNDMVSLIINPFGGHCGYIKGLSFDAWFRKVLLNYLALT